MLAAQESWKLSVGDRTSVMDQAEAYLKDQNVPLPPKISLAWTQARPTVAKDE